nr:EOG090X0EYV [Triops cancriformis]
MWSLCLSKSVVASTTLRIANRTTYGLFTEISRFRELNTASNGTQEKRVQTVQVQENPQRDGRIGYTEDGGIRYPGFVYYPRHSNQQDPLYTPSMVHMVKRVRCLKKKPQWEKDIMKDLGLDGDKSQIAIVANTPAINRMLWDVKHLVRITPVTFPQGLPQDGDLQGTRLLEDGRFIFSPLLKEDATRLSEKPNGEDVKRMDGKTLAKQLRLNWIQPYN